MSINYTIIRKKNLKRIYLRVNNDLAVEVRAGNGVPKKIIDEFVFSKIGWIDRRLRDIQHKNEIKIKQRNKLLYLGDHYSIDFDHSPRGLECSFNIINHKVVVATGADSMADHNIFLDLFYKNEAKKIILPMVCHWASKMQLEPNKVSFRKNSSRWGSCSWQNNLSFNYLLMKLPLKIVEYIVVHELAHIEYKNHSKLFWLLVREYFPDYIEARQMLRNYEKIIF